MSFELLWNCVTVKNPTSWKVKLSLWSMRWIRLKQTLAHFGNFRVEHPRHESMTPFSTSIRYPYSEVANRNGDLDLYTTLCLTEWLIPHEEWWWLERAKWKWKWAVFYLKRKETTMPDQKDPPKNQDSWLATVNWLFAIEWNLILWNLLTRLVNNISIPVFSLCSPPSEPLVTHGCRMFTVKILKFGSKSWFSICKT